MATVFEQDISRLSLHGRMNPLINTHTFHVTDSSNSVSDLRRSASRSSKHPQYDTQQARLDSFTGWPGRYVPKSPEELSTAGFFYIGSADRVTCFQCGITLRDWEEEHNPVTEHRRYSENCKFINTPDLNQLGVVTRSLPATSPSSNLQTDSVPLSTSDDDLEVDGSEISETANGNQIVFTSISQASTSMVAERSGLDVDHLIPSSATITLSSEFSTASLDDEVEVDDVPTSDEDLVTDSCSPLSVDGHQVVADADADAVTTLKEMGFSENAVGTALVHFRNEYGRKHRDQSELVEFILDRENEPRRISKRDQNSNLQVDDKKTDNTGKERADNSSPKSPGSPKRAVIAPLKAENQRLKEQRQCRNCKENDVGILFLPCGHLVTCEACADTFVSCNLCGKDILGTVKTYLT